MGKLSFSRQNYQKKLKRLKFCRDIEDENSPSQFYYPKDLENLVAETETGSAFYYQ